MREGVEWEGVREGGVAQGKRNRVLTHEWHGV